MRLSPSFRRPSPWLAIAVLTGVVACGGYALAASTSSPVLRACAAKQSGALRAAGRCTSAERVVSWNKAGPQGPPGAAGQQGPAGSQGAQGTAGQQGPAGSARAYATMRPDECFHANAACTIYNLKNVASIRRVGTGTYCVAPGGSLSFEGATPALTTDSFNSGPANNTGVPIVAYSSLGTPCAKGELKVQTYRATGATPTIALSNSTSFGVVVP